MKKDSFLKLTLAEGTTILFKNECTLANIRKYSRVRNRRREWNKRRA